ncbi:hypothetical protein, partial [Nocardia puris]|uniref:AAA family ATPase n=1 Tax=Nocardia puris TaxID=208602 RepID=UPI001E56699F
MKPWRSSSACHARYAGKRAVLPRPPSRSLAVPAHLRDGHYAGAAKLGNAQGYKYPHDDPDGVLAQQYPPDE